MDKIYCTISELDVVVEAYFDQHEKVFSIKHVWIQKSNNRVDILDVLPTYEVRRLEKKCAETL